MWLDLAFSVKVTGMKIDLPADQQKWLEAEVAAGRFASVGEAVEMAIAGLMIDEDDDLSWAKPYVDEARAAVARGEVITAEEFFTFLDQENAKLRSR
jgi:antitoxin ParD1/3/4